MFRFIFGISIILAVLSACSNDDNNSNNALRGNIPELITLNYPSDFPYSQQIPGETLLSLQPILVNGLASDLAYELTYTSISTKLSVLAVNNSASGGFFCGEQTKVDNDTVCTGTPNGNSIALSVSNASGENQPVTINIVPSSTRPWISQGSESNPMLLTMGVDFPFDASVGTAGNSYYQLNNLIPGAKYQVDIPQDIDNIDMKVFYDQFSIPVDCELGYSFQSRCVFVSKNDFATLRIDGSPFFGGTTFILAAQLLSLPEEFEGTWYQPLKLDLSVGELPHLATIDGYSNYYHITGLMEGRQYTVQYTSKTIGVNLEYYDPATGSFASNIDCNPDNRNLSGTPDGGCTFTGVTEGLYIKAITSLGSVGGGRFVINLKPEPMNEGSLANPVQLVYDGSILRYGGQVGDSKSYYRISGISLASEVMVRLAGDAIWQNTLSVYDGDSRFSTPASCMLSSALYCILTVSGDLYISVDGVTSPPGRKFTLNVAAPPVKENLQISAVGTLPYAGQVDKNPSRYTFTGLSIDTNYIIKLSNAMGDFRLAAWKDTSTTEDCYFATSDVGGCLLNSGPNGTVLVSIRNGPTINDPGGHFTIDFTEAPQLSSDYQLLNAVSIPDAKIDVNGVGISSQLTVINSLITGIKKMSVDVFVEHGNPYDLVMQLIAPNGDAVMLVKQQAGSAYINTRFSDYADSSILSSGKGRYNKTFRPASPLYLLNGNDANGVWTLKIADTIDINTANSKGGILHGWGLSFE